MQVCRCSEPTAHECALDRDARPPCACWCHAGMDGYATEENEAVSDALYAQWWRRTHPGEALPILARVQVTDPAMEAPPDGR